MNCTTYLYTDLFFIKRSCCWGNNKPKWQGEMVSDHRFDHINLDDFHNTSLNIRFKYLFLFISVFKSFAVYIADLWTAGKAYLKEEKKNMYLLNNLFKQYLFW